MSVVQIHPFRLQGGCMSREQMYVMVNMERRTPEKTLVHTAWIPEQFAVKGKYLKLDSLGENANGWQVLNDPDPTATPRPVSHFIQQRRAAGQLV